MTNEQAVLMAALINGQTLTQSVVLSYLSDRGVIDKTDLIAYLEQAHSTYTKEAADPQTLMPLRHLMHMLRGERTAFQMQ